MPVQAPPDFWQSARDRWRASVDLVPTPERRVRARQMWRYSLRRTDIPIAITGMRGTGKTTLRNAIAGRVNHGYIPPGRSLALERDKLILLGADDRLRSSVYVLPGQISDRRAEGLDRLFGGGRYPAGVIHVVAWGYNMPWSDPERRALRSELADDHQNVDLEAIRRTQLVEELEDFAGTCSLLKDSWQHKSDVWLIVALAKCDLYWPQAADAGRYYLPDEADTPTPFFTELRGLVNHLGEANLARVAVLPVCPYPAEYQFDQLVETRTPSLDFRQSSILMEQFLTVIGEFCGIN
jgi:hypothetical protein